VSAALDVIEAEPWRRVRVLELAERLRRALGAGGLERPSGSGPIVPVILGTSARAMRVAEEVRSSGYDVRAVRPPAVPPRTSRIRVSVHADHSEDEIDGLAKAVVEAVWRVDREASRPEEEERS
jgi:8-amino-7-oxononanoate synthase